MHSTVYCAMLALPIFGCNTANGLQPFDNEVFRIPDVVTNVKVVQPYLTPFQLSARDDRIKDCLRSGNCKN